MNDKNAEDVKTLQEPRETSNITHLSKGAFHNTFGIGILVALAIAIATAFWFQYTGAYKVRTTKASQFTTHFENRAIMQCMALSVENERLNCFDQLFTTLEKTDKNKTSE